MDSDKGKVKSGRSWLKPKLNFSSSPLMNRKKSARDLFSNKKADSESHPSSPVAKHSSKGSVDVASRSLASASSGAANTLKLVSSTDESGNGNEGKLPMPTLVSSMTLSSFLSKDDVSAQQAKSSLISGNHNNSTMSQSDSAGLPLRSAPNGNQKPYNMDPYTTTPPAVNGNAPAANGAYSGSDRLPLPNRGTAAPISTVRNLSGQFGGARSHSNLREVATASDASAPPEWSSAVGGATTSGKSGRVIEKLMGERDSLKRDVQVLEMEKKELIDHVATADEKMQRQLDENASELHAAGVNKLLLKKRDRQVMELKERIEIERRRADQAVESERVWKAALEKLESDTKRTLSEWEERATSAEGHAKIMANHWENEKKNIEKAHAELKIAVNQHMKNVVAHSDTLRQRDQIYEQNNRNLTKLEKIQEQQQATYKSYKEAVNQDLSQIKAEASARAEEADQLKEEVQETLDKMKWAMNVKKNVKDAE